MTSVGKLRHLNDRDLAKVVSSLESPARMKLAHLASLGVARELEALTQYNRVLHALTEGSPDA